MNDPTIVNFIREVKEQMAAHAEAAMLRPRPEPFAFGVTAGVYQGLQKSLDILDQIIGDQLEKEKHS